ncbi:inorganic phosphate transporter family protein [Metabacillus sp. GX 13764]|uniref:inorganic phosphate transporter n=1 Tax=Metabacillus kandeliae TaxID=2900151 RepID=UPI001E3C7C3F|nr:inorganic phosphate transporter [Metabacillus kandeliae]MCD7033852.1 inorganic phosphate transporter family protein [Metabacillus kandeliae]
MAAIAILVSLFFALNIGASGAAASMGVAYGAGVIKKRYIALLICAAGVILGAVLGGGEVVKTISGGIVPKNIITVNLVIIIISSAALSLFLANLMAIPLSTSEVTVGAVVGVGVACHVLYIKSILVIAAFWIFIPAAAFFIAYAACRLLRRFKGKSSEKSTVLSVLLIAAGFFEAFSAGMNNVANAVGPLVAASIMDAGTGIWSGALFVALGAVLLGGRVLETNGKKITNMTKKEGIVVSGTGAFLVILSSIFGLPVPLTQVTSTAIMASGAAKNGKVVFQKNIVKRIVKVWIVSPLVSLTISYILVKLFIQSDFYSTFLALMVIAATVGVISLTGAVKKEKQSIHEQGGGI